MIPKLFFSIWIYLILSMLRVNSYVLFAANIDDFRSLAKKIIPSQLAAQLANMATKQNVLSYRNDQNDAISDSYSNEDSSETEDSNYSEANYKSPLKDKRSKKTYKLNRENIDLDELVKRVKEKLETDYNVTSDAKNVAAKTKSIVKKAKPTGNKTSNDNKKKPEAKTDSKIGKIEDYYYRDEILNNQGEQYDEEEISVKKDNNPDSMSDIYDAAPQYEGQNIDYNEEEVNEGEYAQENAELLYKENLNEKYKQVTKKQLNQASKVKEMVRDSDYGQEVREFDEYGNILPKQVTSSIKSVSKKVPQQIQDYPKIPEPVSLVLKPNTTKYKPIKEQSAEKEPEYYDDVAETAIEPEQTGDLFKEIDMLKTSNDSYEDYVTPERDNVFESAESVSQNPMKPILGKQKFAAQKSHFKIENRRPKAYPEPVITDPNDGVVKPPVKNNGFTPNPEFIRAKTASMWYKDPNIENYDDSTKKVSMNAMLRTSRKPLRTMFPTKAHVRFSSPSYFAKLPAVAEKYNFNEPIPEKDREPEKLKHFVNPPAMINKKIKI